jgi:peptide/nickel transport system substrate-binding protein
LDWTHRPRFALAVTLILVLLAGCATNAQPATPVPVPSARPAPGSATPTPAPRRGGGAIIGVVGDLRQMNPAFGGANLPTTIFRPVVEGLFDVDAQGQAQPWLAESVPSRGRGISDDGLIVIIRLRQGIAWEDGKPFVADDVVFTLAVGQDPANRFDPALTDAYRTIRSADALDAYTVRLTLVAPGHTYLRAFSPVFPVHLSNGATDLANQPYARAPFGTGPFHFADWIPGESLTLRRSPSYRLGDRPYLEALTFRAFPDAAAAETALRAGTIDLALSADGQRLIAPQDGAIYGLAPQDNRPSTWNAGDWYRGRP